MEVLAGIEFYTAGFTEPLTADIQAERENTCMSRISQVQARANAPGEIEHLSGFAEGRHKSSGIVR